MKPYYTSLLENLFKYAPNWVFHKNTTGNIGIIANFVFPYIFAVSFFISNMWY